MTTRAGKLPDEVVVIAHVPCRVPSTGNSSTKRFTSRPVSNVCTDGCHDTVIFPHIPLRSRRLPRQGRPFAACSPPGSRRLPRCWCPSLTPPRSTVMPRRGFLRLLGVDPCWTGRESGLPLWKPPPGFGDEGQVGVSESWPTQICGRFRYLDVGMGGWMKRGATTITIDKQRCPSSSDASPLLL